MRVDEQAEGRLVAIEGIVAALSHGLHGASGVAMTNVEYMGLLRREEGLLRELLAELRGTRKQLQSRLDSDQSMAMQPTA